MSSCTTVATFSAFPATDQQLPAMVRTFLVRGMLVGIVAGLLSFAFLKVYGEPQVDLAVAFETQQDEAKAAAEKAESHDHSSASHDHTSEAHAHTADHDEPELVSRSVQAGLGLFVAVVVYNAAFGGLFGLAFAFAYGRTASTLTPQALSMVLAATGFVAIYLVPNLKYPANPPAVGEPETIGIRTALYFVMIAISLAAMIASLATKRFFVARLGAWNADLLVAVCYIVLVGIAALLLPAVNEVPDGFPAVVLWNFRIASIGAQLIMWATLGLLFGALSQRALNDEPQV
jgi:predicted cobalt transporter CbtA